MGEEIAANAPLVVDDEVTPSRAVLATMKAESADEQNAHLINEGGTVPRRQLVLTFKPPEEDGDPVQTLERTPLAGCATCSNAKGSAGSFEITLPSDDPRANALFSASPMKGSVSPGQTQTISFTFSPPPSK